MEDYNESDSIFELQFGEWIKTHPDFASQEFIGLMKYIFKDWFLRGQKAGAERALAIIISENLKAQIKTD